MKQPIEERRRKRCVVGEGLVSLAERQNTRQDSLLNSPLGPFHSNASESGRRGMELDAKMDLPKLVKNRYLI